jgi:hypothetical protein
VTEHERAVAVDGEVDDAAARGDVASEHAGSSSSLSSQVVENDQSGPVASTRAPAWMRSTSTSCRGLACAETSTIVAWSATGARGAGSILTSTR